MNRRDLLKALPGLALPAEWAEPVVEVGWLPIHAQASGGVVISGLVIAISKNICNPGDAVLFGFYYTDHSGNVTDGSRLVIESPLLPNGIEIRITFLNYGDGYSGAIIAGFCTPTTPPDASISVYLINAIGQTSNTLTGILADAVTPETTAFPFDKLTPADF